MLKIIYGLIPFIIFNCMSSAPDLRPNVMVSDFFQMPIREQVKEFREYTLDQQYELLRFGNEVVHPPASYLVSEFAEQGKEIVPFLKSKLKSVQTEVNVRDIVQVFWYLAKSKRSEFLKDQELIDSLGQQVQEMRGIWREYTLSMYNEILSFR
jgi:hypothetical protein